MAEISLLEFEVQSAGSLSALGAEKQSKTDLCFNNSDFELLIVRNELLVHLHKVIPFRNKKYYLYLSFGSSFKRTMGGSSVV